jgi:hypothetical protein
MEEYDIKYINNLLYGTKLNIKLRGPYRDENDRYSDSVYILDNLDNGKEIKFMADRVIQFVHALIDVEAI